MRIRLEFMPERIFYAKLTPRFGAGVAHSRPPDYAASARQEERMSKNLPGEHLQYFFKDTLSYFVRRLANLPLDTFKKNSQIIVNLTTTESLQRRCLFFVSRKGKS